jgi:hypothetical protein
MRVRTLPLTSEGRRAGVEEQVGVVLEATWSKSSWMSIFFPVGNTAPPRDSAAYSGAIDAHLLLQRDAEASSTRFFASRNAP